MSAHRSKYAPALLALALVSCSGKLREAGRIDLSQSPVQTVNDMFAVQTKDGNVMQRMEAPVMQRFDRDTESVEFFPSGVAVYGYTEEGLLETVITARQGRHSTPKRRSRGAETWSAFGDVVIRNVIKRETMETDTIYWDRNKAEIYTDCYVKMHSPSGMMQGYGMRSDERARNATLLSPFDSYGYSVQDTTKVVVDSVNFIGPM